MKDLFFAFSIFLVGCSSGYYDLYKLESEKRLHVKPFQEIVTIDKIKHLPVPIQNYLHYVGAIGKPKIYNFHVVFNGEMKRKIDADWLDVSAQQYEFFGDNARLFYIRSSMFGIPFDGLHSYVKDSATMKITVASLFEIVDAKGDTMTKSETVTLFNDICLFAPTMLLDSTILWESVDSLSVNATFTNRKQTISAHLRFNNTGELINFISNDRSLSEDGKTYLHYQWSTPVKDYKEFEGRKIPTYAEAVWHLPEGEFTYARFTSEEIEFNCSKFK